MEHLVDDDTQSMSLDVTLEYDPADPFAVNAALHAEPHPVRWTFARELLIDGAFEPTGAGDVLVWPSLDESGHAVVVISLSSPWGEFMGQIQTQDILPFIQDMLTAVPSGKESASLDLDAAIEKLLTPPGER
jgi:hypothetical protein